MAIIDRFRHRVRSVLQRLSGDYSAAAAEIRPDTHAGEAGAPSAGAPVTRARLKRPGAAEDQKDKTE